MKSVVVSEMGLSEYSGRMGDTRTNVECDLHPHGIDFTKVRLEYLCILDMNRSARLYNCVQSIEQDQLDSHNGGVVKGLIKM